MYASAIEELNLSYNRLGAESCQLLCASLQENAASPLRRLHLSGNPLRVGGGRAIAALLATPTCRLEELQLANTELEVENLIAIATALRSNGSLHTLNLDNPVVRSTEEEAIQHIGKMLQVNDTLRALSLGKHQLTDPRRAGAGGAPAGQPRAAVALAARQPHRSHRRVRARSAAAAARRADRVRPQREPHRRRRRGGVRQAAAAQHAAADDARALLDVPHGRRALGHRRRVSAAAAPGDQPPAEPLALGQRLWRALGRAVPGAARRPLPGL
ncbi:hypothetical protein PINS_up019606 [Pythium insidiosum]|nr:hypothetical protein PINS_up019606 [Pythium insidiosum]